MEGMDFFLSYNKILKLISIKCQPRFSYNMAHIIFVFVVVVYHNILSVGVQIIPLLVLFLFCLSRFLYDSGQV